MTLGCLRPDVILDLSFVLDGRLSPDANLAAFVVASVDRSRMADQSSIWVVDVAGGEPRSLTTPGSFDLAPVFSPDGQMVAFRSARAGVPQVFTVPVDGGDVNQLTFLPSGVGMCGPEYSPAGDLVAFSARAKPPRDPAAPYRVKEVLWRLDGVGLVDDVRQELFVVSSLGGEPRQISDHDGVIFWLRWSPSGDEVMYASGLEPDHRRYTIRVCNVTSGDTTVIYDEEWLVYPPMAAWLPDGRIVCTTVNELGMGVPIDLMVIGDPPGASRMPASDGWIYGIVQGDFPFTAFEAPRLHVDSTGGTAFASVQVGGRLEVWRVALDGVPRADAVVSGDQCDVPFDLVGDTLLVGSTTIHDPPDLWVCGVDGSDHRRLTNLNEGVLPAEERFTVVPITVDGADGTPVEGWFLAPPGAEGPVPTLLNNHGGPHAAWGHAFSFDNWLSTSAGFGVLLVNQRGSTGYSRTFAQDIHGDFGNHDVSDLERAVDEVVRLGLADSDRLGVWGISAGAFLTAWLVTHSDRFGAAIVESPLLDWAAMLGADVGIAFPRWLSPDRADGSNFPSYAAFSPTTFASNCQTPILLIQHERDLRTPPANSDLMFTLLKLAGAECEMLRMPVTPHAGSLDPGDPRTRVAQNEALLEWFSRHLGKP